MEIFYEESSIAADSNKAARKYKTVHILSNVFLAIGILLVVLGINLPAENPVQAFIGWLITVCSWFFVAWFCLYKIKQRLNVSYDYVFVSGELRIARVINTNKRKFVARLQPEDILQLGDVDSESFQELVTDSNVKHVYCTSNNYPTEGKFFMYILVHEDRKKLYVIECREEMLIHYLKFVKRTTLANDYVAQEKKQ